MKLPPLKVIVKEGEVIPKWYGPAYYIDFSMSSDKVCMPFPIFWIVWFWHEKLKWWLLRPTLKRQRWEVRLARHQVAMTEILALTDVPDGGLELSEIIRRFDRIHEVAEKVLFS